MKKNKSTPTNPSKIVINHKLDKLAKKDLFPENRFRGELEDEINAGCRCPPDTPSTAGRAGVGVSWCRFESKN